MKPVPLCCRASAFVWSSTIASPRPASNSSTNIGVDRSRSHVIDAGSTPASRTRPAVKAYGALPPMPGASTVRPIRSDHVEVRLRRPGHQGLGELVVDLGDDRQLAGGARVHRGHPQAAERDVGGAAVQVVEHAGPRILRGGRDGQAALGEQAEVVGVVLRQVVQSVGGGGDVQCQHVRCFSSRLVTNQAAWARTGFSVTASSGLPNVSGRSGRRRPAGAYITAIMAKTPATPPGRRRTARRRA